MFEDTEGGLFVVIGRKEASAVGQSPSEALDADLYPGRLRPLSHDSAACLLRDGELVAAAEEERFSPPQG